VALGPSSHQGMTPPPPPHTLPQALRASESDSQRPGGPPALVVASSQIGGAPLWAPESPFAPSAVNHLLIKNPMPWGSSQCDECKLQGVLSTWDDPQVVPANARPPVLHRLFAPSMQGYQCATNTHALASKLEQLSKRLSGSQLPRLTPGFGIALAMKLPVMAQDLGLQSTSPLTQFHRRHTMSVMICGAYLPPTAPGSSDTQEPLVA